MVQPLNHITIVGGGIIGLTTALYLKDKALQRTLLDIKPITSHPLQDNRIYALNHTAIQLFKTIGITNDYLKENGCFYTQMTVTESQSNQTIHFNAKEEGLSYLGLMIKGACIHKALLTLAQQDPSLTIMPNASIQSIIEQNTHLTLKVNTVSSDTDLLIIADGANSLTKQQLTLKTDEVAYHQDAITGLIQTEKPHQYTALQLFTALGILAFLPTHDPHQCGFVFSVNDVSNVPIDCPETFSQLLSTLSKWAHGAVQVIGTCQTFPLVQRQSNPYAGKYWCLLGDAAHTIHPLAGLGLNIGLEDLIVLNRHLKDKSTLSRALKHYHRDRYYAVLEWQMIMKGLCTLLGGQHPHLKHMAGIGIGLCDKLPFIKRLFVNKASLGHSRVD